MPILEGKHVAVIATDGFEEAELTEPVRALRVAGANVTIVAPQEGAIRGFRHFAQSTQQHVDRKLDSIRVDEFDAIVLPGGALNADQLRMSQTLRGVLQDFDALGKPIAAICHAPWILISAGLVKGRTLTSYFTVQDDIRNAGGQWVDREVVEDGNWITSRKPDDLTAFCRAMIRKFAETRPQKSAA